MSRRRGPLRAVTVVVALVTAILAGWAARAAEPEPAVALDVTLDPSASRVAGHARLRIVNRTNVGQSDVPLWLYANHLATRSKALGDVTYHWLYPGVVFSPAAMTVSNARVDGAPARMALEDTPAGTRTIARVALAAPLLPGAAVTIDVDFDTKLPRRFGGFGCDGLRCRMMGGFYPMPPAQIDGAFDLRAAPARAGRVRVTLRTPRAVALVVNGEPVVWPGTAGAITVESADLPYPTIVTDRVLRPETITVDGHVVRYLHRDRRPPGSEDQALPYVREDVTALVLKTAERALQFADLMLGGPSCAPTEVLQPPRWPDPARTLPITLIEAPLRHQLVQAHGNVILVSDQIFRIFPVNRLRKYHHQELAHAILAAVVDARIAATEAGRRSQPGGRHAGRLPDRALHAAAVQEGGVRRRSAAPVRLRPRGRSAPLRAAARFVVELLRRRAGRGSGP